MSALKRKFARGAGAGKELLDRRTATAALLVHAIVVDGELAESEFTRLHRLLSREYGLDDEEASALIERAKEFESEAVDLYSFSSLLRRELDPDGRQRVVAMLWEMVYADGEVHEFEDNLVWRAAELLGVSSRDRLRIKKEVHAGEKKGSGKDGMEGGDGSP